MAKSFTYIIIITTLMILLSVFNIIDGQTSNVLQALNYNEPGNFKFGELFGSLFNLLTIGSFITGVFIGYLYTRSPEYAIRAGFVLLLGGWLFADMVAMITTFNANYFGASLAWISIVIKGIIFIMMGGLVVSIVQLWGGND